MNPVSNLPMSALLVAMISSGPALGTPDVASSNPTLAALQIDESSLFDPTAIVEEIGEAHDSPRTQEEIVPIEPSPTGSSAGGSVWTDIAGAFAFPELKPSSFADLHRRRLTHSDQFVSNFLLKADPYLAYVWDQVNRRGLPGELALLPFVESAYSPWAVSHAGAEGMWQIMPGTAEILGLKQGKTCDQRRDIILSTRAALDYLEQMHQQFDDWLLAVAAYNAGPGRIERAIKQNKSAGKPTDFWSLSLPRETRRYVPRLLVLRNLVLEAEQHNTPLPPISRDIPFRVLQLEAPMEVALVQELSGLSLAEVRRFNPCIRSWVTPAQSPYRLVLPVDAVQPFSQALVSVSVRDYIRTRPYEIQRGDSLSSIALRHDSTVAELMTLNGLKDSLIVTGRTLRVPSTDENIKQQLALMELNGGSGESMRYQIKPGDSLWNIAQRFGTSVELLSQVNGTSHPIFPGDWLTIPVR